MLPVFDRLFPVRAQTSYLFAADNDQFDKTVKVRTNPFFLTAR